ncbi:energy transducer TonB [Halomonas sp. MCCC 1A17488]|uniref:energy transducer TonB n=1 Tax=unclassified Halomonas TaxID=2609666 RepID=UPI0018D250F4|nr:MULTISPECIES: TonB family protein [unclassified Halomonas]MCE8017213.1 energy transducer TonB [Halomonas sp. MCCC 1A17488]MCG3240546.1 energy transducer TonB [Halomonas sp. MCCC 1A17488]QPP49598.1 energy transducer TonB [Halomonas sp. SS10-MC5]
MAASISDSIHYAPVTRPYRRWLALSAALLLHLLLFGIVASRQFAPAPLERTSLDVVLVTRPAEAPVDADAIAEAEQAAAGEQAEEAPAEQRAAPLEELPVPEAPQRTVEPATSSEAERPDAEPADEAPAEAAEESEAPPRTEPQSAPPPEASSAEPSAAAPSASGRDLLAQATSSIRQQGLDANLAGPADDPPRSAARRAAEARYIDDWTRRVEDYGNRVHPAPSHLHGQLRIRVVIGRDGQLRQAEVIQSSGHTELDQAALDTVRGAGPYRPFDSTMGERDSLSITRVWRFGQGNHFGVR